MIGQPPDRPLQDHAAQYQRGHELRHLIGRKPGHLGVHRSHAEEGAIGDAHSKRSHHSQR